MDLSQALGTEFQEVRELEHDGRPARAVEGSRVYSTEIEDLWQALTDPERLARWFSPIEGDLKLGGSYQIKGNAGGTITRCDPPEAIDLTWEFSGNVSWVSVRLKPEANGTLLKLVHTMLKDEASEAHWAEYGAGATGVGWDLSFLGLGLHLESDGESIDFKATEAWMATAPGRAFLRACAESWGRAHATSGETEDVAQAMAARTASFYAGD